VARLPYLSAEDLDEADRELMVRPINLFRILANSPGALKMWHQFGEWIRWDSIVDPRLRELAILQVGYLTSSDYEFSHHVKIGFDFGVTDEDVKGLALLEAGHDVHFSRLDLAVLKAAKDLTNDVKLDDADFEYLLAQLGRQAIEELVVIIGFYAMVVRVIAAVELDVEPDYQGYLETYPLPVRTAAMPSSEARS
jgi:alkylhydroperoxidase family enzyme